MKKILTLWWPVWCLLCLSFGQAEAQTIMASRLFVSIDSFLVDGERWMRRSNSPRAQEYWGKMAADWPGYEGVERATLVQLCRQMALNGLSPTPHFEDLFGTLSQTTIQYKDQRTKLIAILDTVSRLYQPSSLPRFLRSTRRLLEEQYIHKSSFNNLQVANARIVFAHIPDEAKMKSEKELERDAKNLKGPDWFGLDTVGVDKDTTDESAAKPDEWIDPTPTPIDDASGWSEGDTTGFSSSDFATEGDTVSATASDIELFTLRTGEVIERPKIPDIRGPHLLIEGATLSMSSVYDSIRVDSVQGAFMPDYYLFVGKKGRAYWTNVGLPENEVYCDFDEYFFNTKTPVLDAHFSKMTYVGKLDSAIIGDYHYVSRAGNTKPNAIYPQFISHHGGNRVKDLVEEVTVVGGFYLKGKKIFSRALSKEPSSIEVSRNEKLRFVARSIEGFTFTDSLVFSPKTSITVIQGQDSLIHPSVQLRYNAGTGEMTARKDKKSMSKYPFLHSYHNVEIDAEYLQWDLDSDSLNIQMLNARDQIPMEVESKSHFDQFKYFRMKGLLPFHPLQLIVSYGEQKKTRVFYSGDLAKERKLNPAVVKGAMIDLHNKGFVEYNPKIDQVKILSKSILYAFANEKTNRLRPHNNFDYDNINIYSISPGAPNGTFLLDSSTFLMRGVSALSLSDSMRVIITPDSNAIRIKKDRDIAFSGKMNAGKFVYRGSNFTFEYAPYRVLMPKIDSISFLIPDSTKNGQPTEMPNNIVNSSGTLFIASRNNKSGLLKEEHYPIFKAENGGDILFGGKEILGGAYGDRFLFDIPNITIDSINASNPEAINFTGTFYSDSVFPAFVNQVVKVQMHDRSFGFKKKTPPDGFPIFIRDNPAGKGRYFGDLSMDNQGLTGKGRIEHLSGIFYSDKFTYYPDSVLTLGQKANIRSGDFQGTSYPMVKMQDYKMRWLVLRDSMLLTTTTSPFNIFKDDISFEGTLAYQPSALMGGGKFTTKESITQSRRFTFREQDFNSTHSRFQIVTADPKKPAMLGDDVTVDYSLKEGFAQMESEFAGKESFSFPYMSYRTSLSRARWDFAKKIVELEQPEGMADTVRSVFISTNRIHKGLEFPAQKATYSIDSLLLNVEGVEEIQVSNSLVKPAGGQVVIRQGGEMDQLENATVVMNAFTQYHTLTEASVKVVARDKFEGTGLYRYLNDNADSFKLTFNFDIETEAQAMGRGRNKDKRVTVENRAYSTIEEDMNFIVQGGYKFRGKAKMVDSKPYLEFEGQAALNLERENNSWFPFKTTGEDSVKINIENLTSGNTPVKLRSGIFLSKESRTLYTAFIEELVRERANDLELFKGEGESKLDKATGSYYAASPARYAKQTLVGNKMGYNFNQKKIEVEGRMALIQEDAKQKEKIFSMRSSIVGEGMFGEGSHELTELTLNALMVFDIPTGKDFLSKIGDDFKVAGSSGGYATDNAQKERLYLKLAQILSPGQLNGFMEETRRYNTAPVKFFDNSVALSEVTLKWSPDFKALYSDGKIGLSNIWKADLNTKVDGFVEFPKSTDNETVYLFLESEAKDWVYISYSKDKLSMLTSNGDVNTKLADKKANKSGIEVATLEEAGLFVNRFRRDYQGKDEPVVLTIKSFDIEVPAEEPEKKDEEPKDGGTDGF